MIGLDTDEVTFCVGDTAWKLRAEQHDLFEFVACNLSGVRDTLSGNDWEVAPTNDDEIMDSLGGRRAMSYAQRLDDGSVLVDMAHVIAGSVRVWADLFIGLSTGDPSFRDNPVVNRLLTGVVADIGFAEYMMFRALTGELDDDADFKSSIDVHLSHPAYGDAADPIQPDDEDD